MKGRLKAFGMHLMLSLAAIIVVLVVVYGLWYPDPYWRIQDVTAMVALLVATTLLLGPPLTLLVYRRGKRHLALDLSVIAVLQLVALGYGTWIIYSERPYFMVFAVDRFNVLAARDVDFATIEDPGHAHKPLRGPRLIVASLPRDRERLREFQRSILFEGKPDLERRPEFWGPYEQRKATVLDQARRLVALERQRPGQEDLFTRVARASGHETSELRYVPVVGKKRDFAIVLDPKSGAVIDAIPVHPWID